MLHVVHDHCICAYYTGRCNYHGCISEYQLGRGKELLNCRLWMILYAIFLISAVLDFFPFLFVYHYVILMLWIVICEPESAWGWSTCCEEDWKCCHWTEQPTKACLHYKRVWWNVKWSLNAANRALLMLLMCRPCLVDESTGRDCRLWIFMIKLPNVTFGSCCNL